MKPFTAAIACLFVSLPASASGQTDFRFVHDQEGVTLLEGIRPVLTYQRKERSKDGRWPRSNYVHPLYDLDGNVLTEDFPEDHGHHRGVFWAWHQVWVGDSKVGDPWLCQDFYWDVTHLETRASSERATILATVFWRAAEGGAPIARESVRIDIHPKQHECRLVDFKIDLLAVAEDVRIGGSEDQKGYGGFSPRIKLSPEQKFSGEDGVVEPTTTSLKLGPWVNISQAGQGVAVLQHPATTGYPQTWILRRSRSMQNAVYPGRKPVALSQSEPTILQYRLVLHRGELDETSLAELHTDYASQATP